MGRIMELKEVLRQMITELSNTDIEVAHGNADDLLMATIRTLARGRPEASMAGKILSNFERVPKWYA